MGIDWLEEILRRLRTLQGDDISDLEERWNLLYEATQIIEREQFMVGMQLRLKREELGEPLNGWGKGRQEQLELSGREPLFPGLSRFRPRKKRVERELLAVEICGGLAQVEADVKEQLRVHGIEIAEPLWPTWLIGLYNCYSDMKVREFFDPRIPSRQRILDLDLPGPTREELLKDGMFDSVAVPGYEILKAVEGERLKARWETNHSIKTLADELDQLEPPLTWGETAFHYMSYLTQCREKQCLRELAQWSSAKRYCILCGKVFQVSKYNVGYFRCPSCSLRLRVQRHRDKKRGGSLG